VQYEGRWITAPQGTKAQRWRARTKFRDSDGQLRDVERYGPTRAKAEARLKLALADRTAPTQGGPMRASMSLQDAGELWLRQVSRPDSNLADTSRAQYAGAFNRWVMESQIAGLSLREANTVSVLESYMQTVADTHGTGAAKTARSVVSGILALAVRYGVLPHNAMRDTRPAKASEGKQTLRDTTRALTRAEREHLLEVVDAHERAQRLDVADLVWFMAGTGVRIGEALAQRWEDVNLEAGTVFVRGTKTATSKRLLTLPPWLVERLEKRSVNHGADGLVFSSPGTLDTEKARDRRNVLRVFRQVFDQAGFPWATPHTLRRTVASLIDQAGLPVALAADVLGHKDASMTARVYLGRRGSTAAAAAVL
jgi:integrase